MGVVMKKTVSPRQRKNEYRRFTAQYTPTSNGYTGQIVEWPEVISEGRSLEDCQESMRDALREMILAYRQMKKEIPTGGTLIEPIAVEI